jgi:hypothetical protein
LARLLANQDAERISPIHCHDQTEALSQYSFNPLEGHLGGIARVGIQHCQRLAGVKHKADGMEVT